MTPKQFFDTNLGRDIDFDGYPKDDPYQCVDVYRIWCRDVLGVPQSPGTGDKGAIAIWDTYRKEDFVAIPNTPEAIPAEGDVVIFKKWGSLYGVYGHIAIVVKADINKITVFEQNYPNPQDKCRMADHTYQGCVGWLRAKKPLPKEEVVQPQPTGELDKILGHFNVKTADELISMVDRELAFLKEARDEITQIKGTLDATKKQYQNLLEYLAGKLTIIVDENEIKGALERLLSTEELLRQAQKDLDKEKETHQIEVNQLKNEVAQLRAEIEKQQHENETLLKRVEVIEDKAKQQDEKLKTLSVFEQAIESIKKLFERNV